MGVSVREAILTDADLAAADEMFITSTTRGVLPVTRLDGQPVGSGRPGPVTGTLAEGYQRHAHELAN